MGVSVKICGIRDAGNLQAAVDAGANFIGFVHYPKSPRHISVHEIAGLIKKLPKKVKSVVVVVEPYDSLLAEIMEVAKPDFLQLHGNETRELILEIRKKFPNAGIIKAIPIKNAQDLEQAEKYNDVADFLLFDAKPEAGDKLHGGNGRAFDWKILSGNKPAKKWFLAGGLAPENVAEAIKQTGAEFVDVSSGIEKSAGEKDKSLIELFIKNAKSIVE